MPRTVEVRGKNGKAGRPPTRKASRAAPQLGVGAQGWVGTWTWLRPRVWSKDTSPALEEAHLLKSLWPSKLFSPLSILPGRRMGTRCEIPLRKIHFVPPKCRRSKPSSTPPVLGTELCLCLEPIKEGSLQFIQYLSLTRTPLILQDQAAGRLLSYCRVKK